MIAALPVKDAVNITEVPAQIIKKTDALYKVFLNIQDKTAQLEKDIVDVKTERAQLVALNSFPISMHKIQNSGHLRCFFGTLTEQEALRRELSPQAAKLASHGEYILLIVDEDDYEAHETLLHDLGFQPIRTCAPGELTTAVQTKTHELDKLIKEQEKLIQSKVSLESEIRWMNGAEQVLSREIKKQELPLSFAVTESSFVAEGWIPRTKERKVKQAIEQVTNNKVHIEITVPGKKDAPPVALQHGKFVDPFTFLLRLFSLPKYKEIDPTSLIFVTFPIFFGFMLGDVVYGLILLGVFYLLKKKVPAAKELASILMFAAVMTIFFGAFFGEYAGFEHVSVATGEAWCQNYGFCLEKVDL